MRSIRKPIKGGLSSVTASALSPSGDIVAFGTEDGGVCLVNFASGKRKRILEIPGKEGDNTRGGRLGQMNALAFSPDGRVLAACADALYFWTAPDGEPLGRVTGETAKCMDCCWVPAPGAPDGPNVAAAAAPAADSGPLRIVAAQGNAVRVWRLDLITENVHGVGPVLKIKGKIETTLRSKSKKNPARTVYGCAYYRETSTAHGGGGGAAGGANNSGDNSREMVVSVGVDKEVHLWGLTGSHSKPAVTLGQGVDERGMGGTKHTGHVYAATASPCAQFLLSASSDKIPRLWHLGDDEDKDPAAAAQSSGSRHKLYQALGGGHESHVRSAAFDAHHGAAATRLAVIGSDDGTARVWAVHTGKCVAVLDAKTAVVGVAFAPAPATAGGVAKPGDKPDGDEASDVVVVCVTTASGMCVWELHVPLADAPAEASKGMTHTPTVQWQRGGAVWWRRGGAFLWDRCAGSQRATGGETAVAALMHCSGCC